jgi:hypothetical protein
MRRVLPPAHATFSASGQTITFATTVPASLSHILRVVNLTRSVVYFNPTGESGLGEAGTASYNSPVLTIKINTQKHADTDELFIEYDDGLGSSSTTLTGPVTVSNEVEIKNDAGNPVPMAPNVTRGSGAIDANTTRVTLATDGPDVAALSSIAGLAIPAHDFISLAYTSGNLTGVVYKTGGSNGVTVGTLALAYNGGNQLISVTRS